MLELLDGNVEVLRKNKFSISLEEKFSFTEELEEKLKLPSKVINVKVEEFEILIPENEIFRLKNIFREHEYSLPAGFSINCDSTIVDIGGNIGAFALYASKWCNDAKVYSFEPNPQVFPLLQINTQHQKNVEKYFFGLGDKNGNLTLYQNPVNTGASSTSISYKGASKISIEIRDAFEVFKELNINQIDVLKIDTEGAEVPILKSLKPMLDSIKVIMLEYHSMNDKNEITKLLENFKFYSPERQLSKGVGTIKCVNKNYFAKK